MAESLAVPQNGCNPFPPKDNGLSSIHRSQHCLTIEQMQRGRRIGSLRAKQLRLIRQSKKLLQETIKVTQTLLDSLSPGSPDSWTPRLQELFELRESIRELDIYLSLREEKIEKPSLTGSLQRVRAKKPGYRRDTDYSPGFLRFWAVWPKKVGKLGAYAEWIKLNPDQILEEQIIAAVQAHLENTWHDGETKYILDPERWLKRGRWEDELIKPKLTREQEIDQEYQRLCKETADG